MEDKGEVMYGCMKKTLCLYNESTGGKMPKHCNQTQKQRIEIAPGGSGMLERHACGNGVTAKTH